MNEQEIKVPKTATTIDEVLDQLDKIITIAVKLPNYIFAFAYVYRRTTYEIKTAILNKEFQNSKRLEKLDVIFANLFISAFYQYLNNKSIAKSWRYAFDVSKEKKSLVQHILLGMNAHINLDLAIAASEVSYGKNIIDLKTDFMKVNEILAGLTNTMQKSLSRVSFFMRLLDFFGFRTDEKIINFSIKKARDFSWINAMELSLLGEDVIYQQRKVEIDKRVWELAKLIANPPGKFVKLLLWLISFPESKDPKHIIKKMAGE